MQNGLSNPSGERRPAFDWWAAADIADTAAGKLNMAQLCLDRHVDAGFGAAPALIVHTTRGPIRLSYADLQQRSARLASTLNGLGIAQGQCVASLLPTHLDFYTTILGTLRIGAVFCPLDPAFGPQPLTQRLRDSGARVVVTTAEIFRRRLQAILGQLPALQKVLVVDSSVADRLPAICLPWPPGPIHADGGPEPTPMRADALALLHFTSGTSGRAKAAVHGHGAILNQLISARYVLDLQSGDIYWCTAEPGWVTATCYGVLAPLACRATVIVDCAAFDARRWVQRLQADEVRIWYTTPTALRLLKRIGLPAGFEPPADLRLIASVGEPLNPDLDAWARGAFGRPVHDTWWQTETGAIMIANRPDLPIRRGAMGQALPGIEAALVRRRADGHLDVDPARGEIGELALRAGWPSMFLDYRGQHERYRQCFSDGWYLSGDLARQDEAGYFWFVGRSDDLIKSAGHLISPFEVESALLEHPAVVDAAVVGETDELVHETVVAFISIAPDIDRDAALERDILDFARSRLGAPAAPRRIIFRRHLPRTRSGKTLRRALKTGIQASTMTDESGA